MHLKRHIQVNVHAMIAETRAEIHSAQGREQFFEELYERALVPVAKFVHKMGGSFQDAKDIFHDALVVYYEKIMDKHFTIHTTEEGYILGISKHLWIKKFNQAKSKVVLSQLESGISVPEDFYPDVNESRLMRFLEMAGKKCMEILTAFYYFRHSMEDITHSFGFSTARSATVQKFKCLEKVRNTIKERTLTYEDFLE